MLKLALLVVSLLCHIDLQEAAVLKIVVSYIQTPIKHPRFARSAVTRPTVCSTLERVAKRDVTEPPGDSSYKSNPDLLFWKSEQIKRSIQNDVMNEEVPGLSGVTVRDVVNKYRESGCWSYLWGGSVRDQFTGSRIKDVDIEISCDAAKINKICQDNWKPQCSNPRSSGVTVIGTSNDVMDDLDAVPWVKGVVVSHEKLEYTANALGYDVNGNDVIVDVTGRGVDDVCNWKIGIPVSREKWEDWSKAGSSSLDASRIFRFWKLREKGFDSVREVKEFIVSEMVKSGSDTFKKQYCELGLGGTLKKKRKCVKMHENEPKYRKYAEKFEEDVKIFNADYFEKCQKYIKEMKGDKTTTRGGKCGAICEFFMKLRAIIRLLES